MCVSVVDGIDHHRGSSLFLFGLVEDGQILLRTYSTMMANETSNSSQENSYDSLLENAQRTVFLKELFAQVNRSKIFRMSNDVLFSYAEKHRILTILFNRQ